MLNKSESPKTTPLLLMQLEARRDFLLQFVKKFNLQYAAKSFPSATLDEKAKSFETEISELTEVLQKSKNDNAGYNALIQLVCAPKQGSDEKGISTNLAKQFGQISTSGKPFVQLDNSGVRCIWNNKNDAERFGKLLTEYNLDSSLAHSGLQDQEVPEGMKSLSDVERYQSDACWTVSISHAMVEKLVRLAQFHPYNIDAVVRDWYAAKKLDRAGLLGQEIRNLKTTKENSQIKTTACTRISYSETEDLIGMSLVALAPHQETKDKHHVVILLDDSGSMGVVQMGAANAALKKLLSNLPNNTLISIQPFNAKTLLYRKPIEEIRDSLEKYCNTPADAGTPLIEMLACSAIFVRKNPHDSLISMEDLLKTTIIVITDGEPSSLYNESPISVMQQTLPSAHQLFISSIQIEGVSKNNFISYGLKGFSCQTLPALQVVSIGNGASTTFVQKLSDHFKIPEIFVRADSNIETDLNLAMLKIQQMRGRLQRVFIGISYEVEGQIQSQGCEEQNLFYGLQRNQYFIVPKDAKNINLFTMVEGNCIQQETRLNIIRNHSNDHVDLLSFYIKQELFTLKQSFTQELKLMVTSSQPLYDPDRRRPEFTRFIPVEKDINEKTITEISSHLDQLVEDFEKYVISYEKALTSGNSAMLSAKLKTIIETEQEITQALERGNVLLDVKFDNEKKQKFIQYGRDVSSKANEIITNHPKSSSDDERKSQWEYLKKETLEKISHLEKLCSISLSEASIQSLVLNLQLFKETVLATNLINLNLKSKQLTLSRNEVAALTQERFGTFTPIPKSELKLVNPFDLDYEAEDFIDYIKDGRFEKALKQLKIRPETVNLLTQDNFKCTPLIAAIVELSKFIPQSNEYLKLKAFILVMLQTPGINLLAIDSKGQTALHRAAWYGQATICEVIINVAHTNNSLHDLKRQRNNTQVGATIKAETVLDNIRHKANKLSEAERIHLQRCMAIEKNYVDVQEFFTTYDREPACLNYHEAKYWNTPLMQCLVEINHANTLDLKQQLRELVYKFFDENHATIDFLEANFEGDTLLHFAIFYGEYSIAKKIIDYSRTKHPESIQALLAARNRIGQHATHDAGGETPHMNLATKISKDFQNFQEKMAAAFTLFELYELRIPEIGSQEQPLDQFLTNISNQLMIEKGIDPLYELQIETEIIILEELRNTYQQLTSCIELCNIFKEGSLLTPLQIKELEQLIFLNGFINNYDCKQLLKNSSLKKLDALILTANDDALKDVPAVKKLVGELQRFRGNINLNTLESLLKHVKDQSKFLIPPKLSIIGAQFQKPHFEKIQAFFASAAECLSGYITYFINNTTSINTLLAVISENHPPIVPPIKQEEDSSVFDF